MMQAPSFERRTKRSDSVPLAIQDYLKALCLKRGLEAAALTTENGELIAGTGRGDVEWMGRTGAASGRRHVMWENGSLHVSRFEVNDVTMCLTTLGAPIEDDNTIGALMRICSN